MAKNTEKKVSIAAVDALLKQVDNAPVTVQVSVGDETLNVGVKKYIPLEEYCLMVDTAANCQFINDADGEPLFVAALSRYAKNAALLAFMTNIKPDTASEKLNKLCTQTDLMQQINTVLDAELLYAYYDAVDRQVTYRKQLLLSTAQSKLVQLSEQMDTAVSAFSKLSDSFSNVDGGHLLSMIDKISSMSEVELANAVVDARDKDFVEQRRKVVEFPDAES